MRTPFLFSLAIVLSLAVPAFANNCCPAQSAAKSGANVAAADPHAGMKMGGGESGESAKMHQGKKDGYTFAFESIPMKGEGVTHHLMVFVKDAAGKAVMGAKVGFDVASPASAGKQNQKVMAMAMGDGYGANLDLSAKGRYTIKVKLVGGGADLLYDFPYEVK